MKVIHIITDLSIGGAEKALFNILNNGLCAKHDNHIISLMNDGALTQPIKSIGVPVDTLGMRQGKPSTTSLIRLNKIIKQIKPKIIQGWMYHGNLAATLASSFASNSTVVSWNIRQTLYDLKNEKRLTRWIIRTNRLLSKQPSALLYNSHVSRKQHEKFGFSPTKSRIIPNGIDLEKFQPDYHSTEKIRHELAIPKDALVIGHVARYHEMKDHVNFLQAANKLVLQQDNVYFLMLGNQIEKENKELTPIITDTLAKKLLMLGEYYDVHRMMRVMDIFCTSSAWGEAFPNVIGEAMATGIPCVATDVGDSARIIKDTGMVIPPKNNIALLNALEKMIAIPKDERLVLGKTARQRIIDNYSITSIATQYEKLYYELIDKK